MDSQTTGSGVPKLHGEPGQVFRTSPLARTHCGKPLHAIVLQYGARLARVLQMLAWGTVICPTTRSIPHVARQRLQDLHANHHPWVSGIFHAKLAGRKEDLICD